MISKDIKKWFTLDLGQKNEKKCGCSGQSCDSTPAKPKDGIDQVFDVNMNRRQAFRKLTAGLLIGAGAANASCSMKKTIP